MASDEALGESDLEVAKEGNKCGTLLHRARVLRIATVVESALVADTDGAAVEGSAVGTYLVQAAVLGDGTVTADVVVVSHVDEAPGKVVRTQLFGGVVLGLARCAAMDDEIVHGVSPHLHARLYVCEEVVLVGDFVFADGKWKTFCCHTWNCLVNT